MNQELYNKLFARLDSLGSIRREEECWYCEECVHTHINPRAIQEPVLSDCIFAIERIVSNRHGHWEHLANVYWDFRKPYLHQQSDELGEKLLELLK